MRLYFQKEILKKINTIIQLTDQINQQISIKLIQKSKSIEVELTNDLKQRCAHYLTQPISRDLYTCKICGLNFDDGRKLGGHVSRAHKVKKDDKKQIPTRCSKKARKAKEPQTNQIESPAKKNKK